MIIYYFFISIIIIFIFHYLFDYLKNTFSEKKENNIISFQIKKLKEMLSCCNSQNLFDISSEEEYILNNDLENNLFNFSQYHNKNENVFI
jgi:hypothetical protein